jgi:hypothetical protein
LETENQATAWCCLVAPEEHWDDEALMSLPSGQSTGVRSFTSRLSRAAWIATAYILAPILLAWAVTRVIHHHLYPSDVRDAAAKYNGYGQVTLRLKLPGTHEKIPEPLISCGKIGNASLVFIKLLPNSRARVGVEFWYLELDQGPEFALPAMDAEIEVTCAMPAFYPEEGNEAWGNLSTNVQKRRRSEYIISVNGVVRLKGSVVYVEPPHSPIYFGVNPLGGSFVSSVFTGRILSIVQRL